MQSHAPILMCVSCTAAQIFCAWVDMANVRRLPCNSFERISSRDAKLLARERALAEQNNQSLVKCYCNICVGSPSSKRSPAMCSKHLEDFGRHPYYRGRTQVRVFHNLLETLQKFR